MVNLWNNYHRWQAIDPGEEAFEKHALASPLQVPQTPGSLYQRKSRPDGAVFRLPPDAKYWTSLPIWQRICIRHN
jgi:hypothetical protein